jgi:hypothetical protein
MLCESRRLEIEPTMVISIMPQILRIAIAQLGLEIQSQKLAQ